MAHVSHKLSNSFEGALAGGGDPATSPLYVFGPFLRLIVVAGVASVTFGTTVWLVVLTIAVVSAMYRLVMIWVTDGSGGSGLSEDEFGGWAVKINAAITFIEYTLTFLVSMAAMVTFIADRVPVLNDYLIGSADTWGLQVRTIVAILLSIMTGWLVNRGPKTAARAFGPATAGVLALLWIMVVFTVIKYGFHLPEFNLAAFSPEYLHFTFGGFTRMLAVMTGIEVFANLVAAYGGKPREKSNKAFGSLMIIMGTTAATMLIVGPVIYVVSEPSNEHVSVFTQTMDALLPAPLPYLGTLVGIAVLLSASAASAQGLQNLSLGLKDRNYIPSFMGQRNQFDVADKPVWLQVGLVVVIFFLAGTNEETYLAIYAAGVFVLLSMTGWAASKRLIRELRIEFTPSFAFVLAGTVAAALITSAATVVIFEERFLDGAWTYFVFVPLLFIAFTYFRSRMGAPSAAAERLGELEGAMQAGFGFGQTFEAAAVGTVTVSVPVITVPGRATLPVPESRWQVTETPLVHIVVPLDGSEFAEQALPAAQALCLAFDSRLTLVSVLPPGVNGERQEREKYLQRLVDQMRAKTIDVDHRVLLGPVAETIDNMVQEVDADMVVISTHGWSGVRRWLLGDVANRVLQISKVPVLVIHPEEGKAPPVPQFKKLLVTLDGSEFAERVLPYVKVSTAFESEVLLLAVPQVPEPEMYGAALDEIRGLREEAEGEARDYLESIATSLRSEGIDTNIVVSGSRPAQTILSVAEHEKVDVIMMATHGRGGLDRLFLGSVAERVVHSTHYPVFLVPIQERRNSN